MLKAIFPLIALLAACSHPSDDDNDHEMSKEAKKEHVYQISEDFCECHEGVRFASPDAIECEDGMRYEGNVLKVVSVDCPRRRHRGEREP